MTASEKQSWDHHTREGRSIISSYPERSSCKVVSISPCRRPGPLCFHLKSVLSTAEVVFLVHSARPMPPILTAFVFSDPMR